ncbi:replication terminator protein [Ligilactobacillus apodemi]|uniref:replication terminator protein n=1 Tax=Ligilactobacillus apodemi TaxID=307126 RepID=UPI00214CCAC6|nr:replication terminator protein [Ligilactobacillus apodemi]MCR1902260.1 replication terminator protein [Ligilactobacillus apodemi]
MVKKSTINLDLKQMAEGGVNEKLERAFREVIENILDPNTDQSKKREIELKIGIKPSNDLKQAEVSVQVKTKLVPENSVPTTILIGKDAKGAVHANELLSGVEGQTFFDPQDSTLKTDTGEPVDEVETQGKVIDLQKRKRG